MQQLQGLADEMQAVLQERGPQPMRWLEEILHTTVRRITSTLFLRASTRGLHNSTRYGPHELFPTLGGQSIYYLAGQNAELGLLVGREWLAGRKTAGRKRSFGFVAANLLKDESLPDGYFAAHAHYCDTNVAKPNAAAISLFQGTPYFMPSSNNWSPRALYMLERVRENRRQHGKIAEIDKLGPRFLSAGFAPTYEQLATRLGWTKAYAVGYHGLASEARMPLRVYVLGSGWSRLFDYGVRAAKPL
jgi:hypothetical protein